MAKKIVGYIRLQVPAGKANPSPPVGPALGQKQLNIMEFCNAFNAKTKNMEPGSPVPVIITAYGDRTFDFETKKPPVSYFIKKSMKIKKGSTAPGLNIIGKISKEEIMKIAQEKIEDMNAFNVEAACKIVEGTARAMGIEVAE